MWLRTIVSGVRIPPRPRQLGLTMDPFELLAQNYKKKLFLYATKRPLEGQPTSSPRIYEL